MRSKLRILITILLGALASSVSALPEDRDQPIYITADSASINDTTGITTYKGNVIIKQGTLLIEANLVDMYRNDDGIDKLIAKGTPAHFRQQARKADPYSDAWGKHIVYEVNDSKLIITQEAKVTQKQDTFTGSRIVYDLDRSIVDAYGQGDDKKNGRVNMVIQPKKKTGSSSK